MVEAVGLSGLGGGGSGRGTGRAGVVGGAVQGPVYSLDSLRSLPGKSAEGLRQMHRLSTSMALAGELNVRAFLKWVFESTMKWVSN